MKSERQELRPVTRMVQVDEKLFVNFVDQRTALSVTAVVHRTEDSKSCSRSQVDSIGRFSIDDISSGSPMFVCLSRTIIRDISKHGGQVRGQERAPAFVRDGAAAAEAAEAIENERPF